VTGVAIRNPGENDSTFLQWAKRAKGAAALFLAACSQPAGAETVREGPFVVTMDHIDLLGTTPARDIEAVVAHPRCANGVVVSLQFWQVEKGKRHGGDFTLNPTSTVPTSDHRTQTFYRIRGTDEARWEAARAAGVRLDRAADGQVTEQTGNFGFGIETPDIDVGRCINGQNSAVFVLRDRKSSAQIMQATISSLDFEAFFRSRETATRQAERKSDDGGDDDALRDGQPSGQGGREEPSRNVSPTGNRP
jgi:hypothetical protein